jgi:hypothetical protein
VGAQGTLNGSVHEDGTDKVMPDVFIRDKNTKQLTITDAKGNFKINTEAGHILIFECPGYISDTLYVVDLAPKKIRLDAQTIALREVSIASTRSDFDPHTEYPDIYVKSKVYPLSPSSWFGKDAVDARRLKKYFEREAQERKIDQTFNRSYVGSIVPLKGAQLESFMVMYRPSYAFITSNNTTSLAAYINDCYKKYQSLPPTQRMVAKLDTTKAK